VPPQERCESIGGVWNENNNTCTIFPVGVPPQERCESIDGVWNEENDTCTIFPGNGSPEERCESIGGVWNEENDTCTIFPVGVPPQERCESIDGVWDEDSNTCTLPVPPREIPPKERCESINGIWNEENEICTLPAPQGTSPTRGQDSNTAEGQNANIAGGRNVDTVGGGWNANIDTSIEGQLQSAAQQLLRGSMTKEEIEFVLRSIYENVNGVTVVYLLNSEDVISAIYPLEYDAFVGTKSVDIAGYDVVQPLITSDGQYRGALVAKLSS